MSVSSVNPSSVYPAPTTTSSANPVASTTDTTSDDDYSSFWNQFDKDCCSEAMSEVNQDQAEEKKQEEEVCPKFG